MGLVAGLLFLPALLGTYGACVSLAARIFGFNSIVAAFLWLPLEVGLRRSGLAEGLLTFAGTRSALLLRLGSLFGLLVVPFLVVLVNSVFISLCQRMVHSGRVRATIGKDADDRIFGATLLLPVQEKLLDPIRTRAPPVLGCPDGLT